MLHFFLTIFKPYSQNAYDKIIYTLSYKEQSQYIKTAHSFHLVDPSPWPLTAALGSFMLTSGLVLYMHKFIGGWSLLMTGAVSILYVMCTCDTKCFFHYTIPGIDYVTSGFYLGLHLK